MNMIMNMNMNMKDLNGMDIHLLRHVLRITWKSGTWWLYGLDKDMLIQLFLALGSRNIFMFY